MHEYKRREAGTNKGKVVKRVFEKKHRTENV